MALLVRNVKVPVGDGDPDRRLRGAIAQRLGLGEHEILGLRIQKKSLDARRKRDIHFLYQVHVDLRDEQSVLRRNVTDCSEAPEDRIADPLDGLELRGKLLRHKPVMIGSGPAGTFAALVLAAAGQPSLIVDRGEPVEQRFRTVGRLRRSGEFDPESNYCYGEGGAGTFSDGKLTCGRNHPLVRYLFKIWVEYGAPEQILYDSHPHIGTDYLIRIAKAMRTKLEAQGTQYLFRTRFVGLRPGGSSARYLVKLHDGTEIPTDHLILALGHSARETYQILKDLNLAMAPKPFAIGARIEHPQDEINRIQFGSCTVLPAAEYKLTAQAGDRGIWTFCMCPGGHLLPTSAQPGHLAINGMSYHARNSGFANSAVVVNVRREDFYRDDVLDGVRFQEAIEQVAFREGGGNYFSPAQRLKDFLAGRLSKGEIVSTYRPGVTSARLDKILPSFVVDALRASLGEYEKRMRGFLSDAAIVAGVETKTSSPVVMPRDKGLQSVSHPGIFPTGEGAGFAGGIVSAALDGARVGRAVLEDALENPTLWSAPKALVYST